MDKMWTVFLLSFIACQFSYGKVVVLRTRRSTETSPKTAEKPEVSIYTPPENQIVQVGDDVTLECETGLGQPSPVINWLRDDNVIEAPAEKSENLHERSLNLGMKILGKASTKSRLFLPCVTAQDAGTYTCIASNGIQTATSQATVTLKDRLVTDYGAVPACVIALGEGLMPMTTPRIRMYMTDRFEREGASIQLFCRAYGFPKPQIRWYRTVDKSDAYTPIDPEIDSDFQYLPNGDLLATNVRTTSFGISRMAKCVASNELGQDEIETFVMITKVKGDPLFAEENKLLE